MMGFSVHGTSDIDSLSRSSFLYSDCTICIYLYNVLGSFSRTVQFSVNAIVSDKHFISYLVVMVYSVAALIFIVFVHIFLFAESDGLPDSNKFAV